MFDPETKIGYATSIQIKLKPGADGSQVRDMLRAAFAPQVYSISTWRDKQGPLLAAVQMETAILNVLLFMIIAVAGFGILAIFFMIVVEKTRDIGILKSLGASRPRHHGHLSRLWTVAGDRGLGSRHDDRAAVCHYINEIADLLGMITGQEVFDPDDLLLPADSDDRRAAHRDAGSWSGAGDRGAGQRLAGARAARLHPVEALRYE